jgi:cytochrome d ubiquinol oxidase subunit I
MGISAYHLLKRQQVAFFTRSFKIALVTGFAASVLVAVQGDFHAAHVAEVQPAKLAAMETLWETQPRAPIYLFSVPDEKNEANLVEFGKIPGLLSFLAFKDVDAEVRGLKAFPREERPPVFISSLAFKGMVGLGTYFILITLVGLLLRNRLTESPLFLKIMMFSIPLPYIANEFGWILAEVGRQPWIVYGMMKTADAASPVDPVQVAISLAGFVVVYGLLGAAGFYLMAKNAIKGPEPVGGEV